MRRFLYWLSDRLIRFSAICREAGLAVERFRFWLIRREAAKYRYRHSGP